MSTTTDTSTLVPRSAAVAVARATATMPAGADAKASWTDVYSTGSGAGRVLIGGVPTVQALLWAHNAASRYPVVVTVEPAVDDGVANVSVRTPLPHERPHTIRHLTAHTYAVAPS